VGPAAMPRDLALKINAAVRQAVQKPELIDKLATIGFTPMRMTTDEFKGYIDSEVNKWIRLAREANVQPE
jgi:tripartite-type tricarboxylate transporter receptor subunit TctC